MLNTELKWNRADGSGLCCCCLLSGSFLLSLLLFLSSSFLWVSSCVAPAVICSTCDLVCVFCLCRITVCFHPSSFSLASPQCWHLFFYFSPPFPASLSAMFYPSVSAIRFQVGSLCAAECTTMTQFPLNIQKVCILGVLNQFAKNSAPELLICFPYRWPSSSFLSVH